MRPLDTYMIGSTGSERAFRRMFWAFPFLLIDLPVRPVGFVPDIMPDFIGWLMIATAFGLLMGMRSDMAKLRTTCYLLAGLSVLHFVLFTTPYHHGLHYAVVLAGLGLDIAICVLDIDVVWCLCGLVRDMASARQEDRLLQDAALRRKLYLGFNVALLVIRAGLTSLYCFPKAGPGVEWLRDAVSRVGFFLIRTWLFVSIVTCILLIVVMCLMMALMKRTAYVCKAAQAHAA